MLAPLPLAPFPAIGGSATAEEDTVGEEPLPVAVSTSALQGAGTSTSYVVLLQDLRPVRQLEDLRLRTGRLEAVAELSASLAHELRNPIASVRSAVEQLSGRSYASESDQVLGRLITRESDRLSRILGEFSDFARVDVTERRLIDVERLLREVIETVRQHPAALDRAEFEHHVHGNMRGLWARAAPPYPAQPRAQRRTGGGVRSTTCGSSPSRSGAHRGDPGRSGADPRDGRRSGHQPRGSSPGVRPLLHAPTGWERGCRSPTGRCRPTGAP